MKFSNQVLNYLKESKPNKYRANHMISTFLFDVFGENLLDDEDLIKFLSKELKFTRPSKLKKVLFHWKDSEYMKKPGNSLSDFEKQAIHNEWMLNSIVTVDRRNGRDTRLIREKEFNNRYSGIEIPTEVMLKPITQRGSNYYSGIRHVQTCTTKDIRNKV